MKGYKIYHHDKFKGVIRNLKEVRNLFNITNAYKIEATGNTIFAYNTEECYPVCEFKEFELIK